MRFILMLACSITLNANVVNESGKKTLSPELLFAQLSANAEKFDLPQKVAASLGIEGPAVYKIDEVDSEDSSDGKIHTVLSFKSESDAGLIFHTRIQRGLTSESFYCRTDLNGTPKQAYIQRGKHNLDGSAVRGSAVITELALESRDLRKALRAELDFWLKGKGRKKSKPAK